MNGDMEVRVSQRECPRCKNDPRSPKGRDHILDWFVPFPAGHVPNLGIRHKRVIRYSECPYTGAPVFWVDGKLL